MSTLWSLSLWTIWRVSKSQMMISAWHKSELIRMWPAVVTAKRALNLNFERSTYLESHVSLLTGGNVFASVADLNHGDVVVMTLQLVRHFVDCLAVTANLNLNRTYPQELLST